MKKPLVVVKLGGSVITYKDREGAFNSEACRTLALQIKKSSKHQFVIAHGAGSFGHPVAAKYKTHEGYKSKRSLVGFIKTKQAVFELTNLVYEQFLEEGVPVSLVNTYDIFETKNKRIIYADLRIIKNLLKLGVFPILSGDVVFDSSQGFAVLSADQIVSYIARKLGARKVVFVSDVDGVFDKDPKNHKDAVKVSQITRKNVDQILASSTISNKNDVTGEMKGKILEIKRTLSKIDVRIINGFRKSALIRALSGDELGTSIRL